MLHRPPISEDIRNTIIEQMKALDLNAGKAANETCIVGNRSHLFEHNECSSVDFEHTCCKTLDKAFESSNTHKGGE